MIKFIDCTLVIVLLLCIEEISGQIGLRNKYTKKLVGLMRSLQTTEGGAKIFRKFHRPNSFTSYGYDIKKCPQRLRRIISDKIKCLIGVSDKLQRQLFSVQIYYSINTDDQLWDSIMRRRNCSELSDESLEMCRKALSGEFPVVKPYINTDVNQELNNCYIEEKGNLSNYMTKR